jgi:NAD(P)-dependent dehydrogenase (short-subunit alcohol dehydrogenase family)
VIIGGTPIVTTIRELSDLTGRRALITGATGNLGKIFSDSLAELGADIVLVDRQGSDFAALSKDLQNRWGIKVEYFCCDLESASQRLELLENLKASEKNLDILINNAAFVGTSNLTGWNVPFEDQTLETWTRAFEVNLTAVFDLCQGLAPLISRSNGGSIINIASMYGMLGPDWRLYEDTTMGNSAAYSASKGGLIQFTRWLSTTVSPKIRVNAIAPGGIFRNQPEEFVKRYIDRTPLRRMASEDDFRGAITFLSSDLSKYVTGQILSVDGGWGSW